MTGWRERRRGGPPEEVRKAVGERLLAAAEAADGTWVLGTRDALHLVRPGREGDLDREAVRVPWERVLRAEWDTDNATLRVERVEDFGEPVTAWSLRLDEPRALLPLVRERVTASMVLERRIDLGRRRGFWVLGRRAPSGRGEVTWAFRFDPGVDPADPDVAAVAESAMREARESLGL